MKNILDRTRPVRVIYCLLIASSVLTALSACAPKHVHKGSGARRLDEFSRVDDSLEEKQLEDAGVPEYLK
ncbi:MAG: hypothetical protein GF392_03965 [Candidatus Omnitrophica bacterium]|nr:hypothetical protein [Candidatus Omnitrophota bacterium]